MKVFLSFLFAAVGAFVLSVPFLIVERWLGFVVLLTVAVAFFALRKRLPLPEQPTAYALGFGVAFALLLPATFFAQIFESGFDDGPFHGHPFAGEVSALAPNDSAAFRSGYLVIYNRDESEAPVLAYRVDGRTRWAREMHVSMDPESDVPELWEMSDPSVARGILRDRLDFTGYWTYGAERGYAYIWKFGGIQRFYLSW